MSYFFYDKDIETTVLDPKVSRKIRAYDEEMMMVEVIFDEGGVGAPHSHMHVQTTYCLEGEFEFTVGDEVKVIGVGDTIFMPPDIVHSTKLLSKKGRVLDVFTPMRKDFLG